MIFYDYKVIFTVEGKVISHRFDATDVVAATDYISRYMTKQFPGKRITKVTIQEVMED